MRVGVILLKYVKKFECFEVSFISDEKHVELVVRFSKASAVMQTSHHSVVLDWNGKLIDVQNHKNKNQISILLDFDTGCVQRVGGSHERNL